MKVTGRGRASSGVEIEYRVDYAEIARKLALLGYDEAQIASVIGVKLATFRAWRNAYPELDSSIRLGADLADADVAEALHKRACGWRHEAVKFFKMKDGESDFIHAERYTEHYPPDTAAAKLWLESRQRSRWGSEMKLNVAGSLETGAGGGISAMLALAKSLRDAKDVE